MTQYPAQQALDASSETQTCRVCIHNPDRTFRVAPMTKVQLRKQGTPIPICLPTDEVDRTHVVKLIPADPYAQVEITTTPDHEALARQNKASQVRLVDTFISCGQKIAPNCQRCVNFLPETVQVPVTIAGASRLRTHQIGGHCALPAEGIEVDGERVQCDFHPRISTDYEPSCANCAFRESSTIGDDFDRIPAKLDLDASERFTLQRDMRAASRAARQRDEPWNPGGFYNGRRHAILTHPQGVLFSFPARVVGHEDAQAGCAERLQLDFGNGRIHWLSEDHEGVDRIDVIADHRVVVTFLGERTLRRCGLVVKNAVKRPVLGDMSVDGIETRRQLTAKIRYDILGHDPDEQALVHPDCTDCQRRNHATSGLVESGPCYFHAKDQHWEERAQTHTARRPWLIRSVYEPPAVTNLQLVRQGDLLRVSDGNGDAPHPLAFKAQFFDLTLQCHTEVERAQLELELRRCLNRQATKISTFEVGWGPPLSGADFAKSHCSKNLEHQVTFLKDGKPVTLRTISSGQASAGVDAEGRDIPARDKHTGAVIMADVEGIDFRRIFGDTFGQPREENDKSWSFTMESDALRYAGITPSNRGEREFSLQRLQEELLVNDGAYAESYGAFDRRLAELEDDGVPLQWKTLHYDTLTIDGADAIEDYDELPEDFAIEDRRAYSTWLDLQVEQPNVEITIEDADAGKHVITKRENTVHFTNRFAVHGYDNVRYARAKRASVRAEGVLTPEDVFQFQDRSHTNPDDFDRNTGWFCLACERRYDIGHEQIDAKLVCECGGALVLRDFDANYKYLPNPGRNQDGTRSVLLKDHAGYQEMERLLSMVCPGWVRRNSSPTRPITLRSLGRDAEILVTPRSEARLQLHRAAHIAWH